MNTNRWLGAAAALSLLSLAACEFATSNISESGNAPAAAEAEADGLAKLARVEMNPDTSFLNQEEREVVNILIQAADLMSEIYKRQTTPGYDRLRSEVAAKNDAALLERFDTFFGPWDAIEDGKPLIGDQPKPAGAGFYPADLTKDEFDAYLKANPGEASKITGPYTVVKRQGDRLVAVPYSEEYRQWLEPAAKLLEQAAARTSNPSLKKFLTLRAGAFRTDDYFASELAWMDLKDTPIEVVIGPYEVYTDELYGRKAAFEAFITLRDPKESAALDVYKGHLRDMEANLPVEEKYKNFQRGFESPTRCAAAATTSLGSRQSPSTCPTTSACARPREPRRSSCAMCWARNMSASCSRWAAWSWCPTRPTPSPSATCSWKRCSMSWRTASDRARSWSVAARPRSTRN